MQKYLVLMSLMAILMFTVSNLNVNIEKTVKRNLIINDKIKKHNTNTDIEILVEREIKSILYDCEETTGHLPGREISDSERDMLRESFRKRFLRTRLYHEGINIDIEELEFDGIYRDPEESSEFFYIYMRKGEASDSMSGHHMRKGRRRAVKIDFSKAPEDEGFLRYIEVNSIGDTEGGFGLLETVLSVCTAAMISISVMNFAVRIIDFSEHSKDAMYREDEIVNFSYFFKENIEAMSGIEELRTENYYGNAVDFTERTELKSATFSNSCFSEDIKKKNMFLLKTKEGVPDNKRDYINEEKGMLKGLNFSKTERESGILTSEALYYKADEILVEPVPEGESFRNASGIKIIFEVSGDTIEKTAYYGNRNAGADL